MFINKHSVFIYKFYNSLTLIEFNN